MRPGAALARKLGPSSVAGHGVARQELGHPSCDGLGALDVQEMPDTVDRVDFLVRELSRAVGLSGRNRRASSASERARVAVTRAVRQAIARIGEHDPVLGAHLTRTIRTGTYCAYLPDPRAPAEWGF